MASKQLICFTFLSIVFLISGYGQSTVITEVNIVDVKSGTIKENMNVFIQNGKISDIISSTDGVKKSNMGFDSISGANKYLVPGFIDTHTHVAMGKISFTIERSKPVLNLLINDSLPQITCDLLLQHGITTSRDPGGKTDVTVATKESIRTGKISGPEYFVAGSILDTSTFNNLVSTVKSKQEIQSEIQNQFSSGADYIKLYTSLPPDLIASAVEKAHDLGLEVISHLHTTSWTEASNLGVDNIVHIVPGHSDYIPERYREEYASAVKYGSLGFYKWFEYVELESPVIREMIRTLKENKTSLDPTLVMFHSIFFGDQESYRENSFLDRLPKSLVDQWKAIFNFNVGWTEDNFKEAKEIWPKVQQFVRMLHDAGVLISAGTDANNPWLVPGDSFHKELELLKTCGLSNADVLKIATLNGARLLKQENRIGSVEIGKEADLVLLNSNPLDDIKNTKDIYKVLVNGILNGSQN